MKLDEHVYRLAQTATKRAKIPLRQVASRAGVTPASIFSYFGGSIYTQMNSWVSGFTGIRAEPEIDAGLRINIGSGSFSVPGWINVDVPSEHYAAVQKDLVEYDLMKLEPLPFEDGSVDLAYTSHTIEHVTDAAVQNAFTETFRCLRLGGVFRITCPNADMYYNAAVRDDDRALSYRFDHWFKKKKVARANITALDWLIKAVASRRNPRALKLNERTGDLILDWPTAHEAFHHQAKDEFLDWLVSPLSFDIQHISGHINWWTSDKIARFLRVAGFSQIGSSSCGTSSSVHMRDLRHFDRTMPYESLYMEAVKTAA